MFLKRQPHRYFIRRQAGFLMPVAAFIIVTMGVLALAISRNSAQTGMAFAQEAISLQTFYAAESGAQWGANDLFFNSAAALTRVAVDGSCNDMSGDIDFTADGLAGCNVLVACACTYVDGTVCNTGVVANYDQSGFTQSFYTITSAATCGSGETNAIRTIVTSAFLEDE